MGRDLQSLTSCLFTVCPNWGLRFYNISYVESQVEVTFHSESMFLCVQLIWRKYIRTTEERNGSFLEMESEQQMFTYSSMEGEPSLTHTTLPSHTMLRCSVWGASWKHHNNTGMGYTKGFRNVNIFSFFACEGCHSPVRFLNIIAIFRLPPIKTKQKGKKNPENRLVACHDWDREGVQ